jgi:hypothetical protein
MCLQAAEFKAFSLGKKLSSKQKIEALQAG